MWPMYVCACHMRRVFVILLVCLILQYLTIGYYDSYVLKHNTHLLYAVSY